MEGGSIRLYDPQSSLKKRFVLIQNRVQGLQPSGVQLGDSAPI